MHVLAPNEYLALLPVLQAHFLTPTLAYSVVYRVIEGEIFVNQRVSPTTIVIRIHAGIYAIIGDLNRQAAEWLREQYTRNRHANQKRFTLFSPSAKWDHMLVEQFGDNLRQVKRLAFDFDRERYLASSEPRSLNRDQRLSEGYRLCRIDEAAILRSQEFGVDYYQLYWGGMSPFFQQGLGFCLERDGQIISECTSIFANPLYAEIDISTHESFRGLGLGMIAAQAFIEACLEKGRSPRWDCTESNTASRQMAARIGFVKPEPYTIFARAH